MYAYLCCWSSSSFHSKWSLPSSFCGSVTAECTTGTDFAVSDSFWSLGMFWKRCPRCYDIILGKKKSREIRFREWGIARNRSHVLSGGWSEFDVLSGNSWAAEAQTVKAPPRVQGHSAGTSDLDLDFWFSFVRQVDERSERSESSARVFSYYYREHHTEGHVPMALSSKAVLNISCVFVVVFSSYKKNWNGILCFY